MTSLVATGRRGEAQDVASAILSRPRLLLDLGSLSFLHSTLRKVQEVGVPFPPDLGMALTAETLLPSLVARALKTPLHFLASFLGYAAKTPELKPVFVGSQKDGTPVSQNVSPRRSLLI
jgi:hypothetical protein